jgi:hypothetical protein
MTVNIQYYPFAISLICLGSAYLLDHGFRSFSGLIGPLLDPRFDHLSENRFLLALRTFWTQVFGRFRGLLDPHWTKFDGYGGSRESC